ncbi:UDP-glucose dehydrogenase family protein [Devosia nitrariae]|uniref:UDP-glucose 6-dehydrogenase n=1 Tax=Devosia nitrariae TaxID=2071872 RepID=A0ABQ5W5V0_9HYPH|nr:UDP-glucose/GDP-mannose dehydrogenase family protein [Devosia nitrariae]GLQ55311.1 UDP-glucose 6-dehydrogenase [Devosia nitrariae]
MKIVMIGTGYVGLTTGACLADLGHEITCVDLDAERIAALKRHELPVFEPGLAELVKVQMAKRRLHFAARPNRPVRSADVVFITVGTPARQDGDADLTQVEAAALETARLLRPGALLVLKSTVPPGTAHRIRQLVCGRRGGSRVRVASNPEFLREGSAIADFMETDRIVIGADDDRSRTLLEEVYEPLIDKGIPLISTSTINAEITKYAANALLALKIGFINQVADLCESAGGDVDYVAKGIGLDKRIGPAFLAPGPGFGGSCFPKDIRSFAHTGRRLSAPQHLIEALIDKNEERKRELAHRILREAGPAPARRRVAILGVAFKANTDDVRESPALTIIPLLQEAGLVVRAHDPKAHPPAGQLDKVVWCDTAYEAAIGADLAVILTDWPDYRDLDLERLAGLMAGHTLMDLRNIFAPSEVIRHGLRYVSIGRPAIDAARRSGSASLTDRVGIAASPA